MIIMKLKELIKEPKKKKTHKIKKETRCIIEEYKVARVLVMEGAVKKYRKERWW